MTRTKEVEPGSGEIPDYKSPAGRLVHSLRKGYDNLRAKLAESRKRIKYYQIKERDLSKSRNCYKEKTKELQKKIKKLEKEKKHLEESVESCKKKPIASSSKPYKSSSTIWILL